MTFDELFQYYADMGFGTQMVPQQTQEGIASLIQPIQTIPTTGGGDGPMGGGAFGNLDLSRSKTFTKDVYTDELGPPGAFEFSPQEIKSYYNPRLGNYQTYGGLNVNPMFSNTGATFGIAPMVMKMMGLTPKTVGGFVPQSIRGYYDTPADLVRDVISRITPQKTGGGEGSQGPQGGGFSTERAGKEGAFGTFDGSKGRKDF